MEIKGRINTAVCYAKVIENEALEQIRRMCDYVFTEGLRIRIMPDVHAGAGCTIGTTMTVQDKAVPNIVGVDIGCGMYTVNLGHQEINFKVLDEAAHFVPSGLDIWNDMQGKFDLTSLLCYRHLKNVQRIARSLGTLGGGNHFIEVDRSADGTSYLVIHTGSRNLGKQVAEYYQNVAIDFDRGKEEYMRRYAEIIRSYKEQGRHKEIQATLEELKRESRKGTMPEDLCFLTGGHLEDYLYDLKICQEFARRNREKIAEVLLSRAGLTGGDSFHTMHNYIDTNEMILRKGAIAAHAGERILIPINMRDGSILALGKGNPEWNYSAPHGAGRIMSRSEARAKLDMSEYVREMEGIYTTSVRMETLDESPMAYKSLDDIAGAISDTADIIEVLKPVYNFKAS